MGYFGRREFLGLAAAGLLAAQQKKESDVAVATATQDTTPRVGIVLSSLAEGADDDGSKIPGLAAPKPADADLSGDFFDAWVRKAIEIGAPRTGDLSKIVSADDWVVIKTHISTSPQNYTAGSITDLRLVRAVIRYLAENQCGARITIAEGSERWLAKSGAQADVWDSDWGGAFGGLSYKKMADDFSKQHSGVRFELADLNSGDSFEGPVPGGSGKYAIGKVIQQCDKLISIAPLKTDARTGVALTFSNYLGIAKSAVSKPGSPEVIVDLFSYHPADYCILGGPFGVEGDGAGAQTVHHNLLLTGTSAVSVDAVGAAVMGFEPKQIAYLPMAERRAAWGVVDTDSVWTRGNTIKEAQKVFRKPSGWQPSKPGAKQ